MLGSESRQGDRTNCETLSTCWSDKTAPVENAKDETGFNVVLPYPRQSFESSRQSFQTKLQQTVFLQGAEFSGSLLPMINH